jgi:hypothetical protein
MKKHESVKDDPDVPLDRNAEKARAPLVFADREQVRPNGERRRIPSRDRQRESRTARSSRTPWRCAGCRSSEAEIERLAREAAQPVVAAGHELQRKAMK